MWKMMELHYGAKQIREIITFSMELPAGLIGSLILEIIGSHGQFLLKLALSHKRKTFKD